jgi:hypothetical protein
VSTIIERLENVFGKMTITRGSTHVFLGMNIAYNGNPTILINSLMWDVIYL